MGRHIRGEGVSVFYDTDDDRLYQVDSSSGHLQPTAHLATFATDVHLQLSDFGF